MAGLSSNTEEGTFTGKSKWKMGSVLKKISGLGMEWESDVIQNSQAIGITEATVGNQGYMPADFLYSLALADIGQKKFVAYFDNTYKEQQTYLRRFAMNGEIEFMVETLADEAIVFDDANYFCKPYTEKLRGIMKDEYAQEIIDYVEDSFIKVYNSFHFSKGHDAWSYFKQFLIDGIIAFEIVYNSEGSRVIGFKELEVDSVRPGVIKGSDGKFRRGWVQYEDNPTMKREFLDEQIIYISYAKENFVGRISYVERMIRSFNLLRILENSRIIWNIMNASFRLKMVVPIGSKSPVKARESLSEFKSVFKEDIAIDFDSGELSFNGRPGMQLYKNYMYPTKNGENVEIETLSSDGPDLSGTEAMQYFYDKLVRDSKVPADRFSEGGTKGGGEWSMAADGMSREEIRFARFIRRLRSIFQEILLKPLMMQVFLKYPELAGDELFQGSLGLAFNEDNLFEELKNQEIMKSRVEFVTSMLEVMVIETDEDGSPEEVPYFDAKFLAEKYLKLDPRDIKKNEEYKKKRKEGEDMTESD